MIFGKSQLNRKFALFNIFVIGFLCVSLAVWIARIESCRHWGLVVDEKTDVPLDGAHFDLFKWGEKGFSTTSVSTGKCDQIGYFDVESLKWDDLNFVILRAPGYVPELCELTIGHGSRRKAQVYRLKRGSTLSVNILDARKIGAKAFLEITCVKYASQPRGRELEIPLQIWSEELDKEGRAVMDGIPSGREVFLTLRLENGKVVAIYGPITPTLTMPNDIEWAVMSGVPCSGRILDQDGKPAQRREVWLALACSSGDVKKARKYFMQDDPSFVTKSITGDDGEFSFGLIPPGDWFVGPGFPRGIGMDDVSPVAQRFHVDRSSLSQILTVQAERGLFLGGIIRSSMDQYSLSKTRVFAKSLEGLGIIGRSPLSNGEFLLGPVEPGEYEITLRSGEISEPLARTRARAGDTNIQILPRPR